MKTELPTELIIKIKEVVDNLNNDYDKVERIMCEFDEFEKSSDCIYPDEFCEKDLKVINELTDILAKFVETYEYLGI